MEFLAVLVIIGFAIVLSKTLKSRKSRRLFKPRRAQYLSRCQRYSTGSVYDSPRSYLGDWGGSDSYGSSYDGGGCDGGGSSGGGGCDGGGF